MIRLNIWGRKNCDPRRIEETIGGRAALQKSRLDKNADREQHSLVVRNMERH